MLGINLKVMVHHLKKDPAYQPIKQKKRNFTLEWYKAIIEVDKLTSAKFIGEVNYPEYLANCHPGEESQWEVVDVHQLH